MSIYLNYDKIIADLYTKLEATMDRVTVLEEHMRSASGKLQGIDTAKDCCTRCANRGNPTHGCPYQVDIENDYDFSCRCCDECTTRCAEDI